MTQLAELLRAAEPGRLESEVFGSTDPEEIAARLTALVAEATGRVVDRGCWYRSSVAAVAAVELDDGQIVVVRAYRSGVRREFIDAVVRVQGHVAAAGFPAARPLGGPVVAGGVVGRVETFLDDPGPRRFAPVELRVSAGGLARLVEAASAVDPSGLEAHPMALSGARLYPPPHGPEFDFEATSEGAGWIDDIAAAARECIEVAGQEVTAHGDWSARNVRIGDGSLSPGGDRVRSAACAAAGGAAVCGAEQVGERAVRVERLGAVRVGTSAELEAGEAVGHSADVGVGGPDAPGDLFVVEAGHGGEADAGCADVGRDLWDAGFGGFVRASEDVEQRHVGEATRRNA